MDCLRQWSQNTCPHFVVTKERPDAVKVFWLSMQMGQVIPFGLDKLESGGQGWLGEDGMMTTSFSSDLGALITSLSFLGIGEVRSITSLSLSAVKSTTFFSSCSSTDDDDDVLEIGLRKKSSCIYVLKWSGRRVLSEVEVFSCPHSCLEIRAALVAFL